MGLKDQSSFFLLLLDVTFLSGLGLVDSVEVQPKPVLLHWPIILLPPRRNAHKSFDDLGLGRDLNYTEGPRRTLSTDLAANQPINWRSNKPADRYVSSTGLRHGISSPR